MLTFRKTRRKSRDRANSGFGRSILLLLAVGAQLSFLAISTSASQTTISLDGLASMPLGSKADFGSAEGCDTVDVPGRAGVSVLLRGGIVERIAVRSTEYLTPSGIGVGFSEKKLLAVYGNSIRVSPLGYEIRSAKSILQFELDGQRKISVIRASTNRVVGCDSSSAVEKPGAQRAIVDDASIDPSARRLGNRLATAYPGVVSYSGDKLAVNGLEVTLNANPSKGTFDSRMKGATIGDQFSIDYPKGCPVAEPGKDQDPGRLRNEALFRAMYGSTPAAVKSKLRSIDWFGSKLSVTTVNDVAGKLEMIRDELNLSLNLRQYLTPSGGTFIWRVIDGTSNLSMHSFGIAIDINTKYSDYWRWSGSNAAAYRNRIPCEIAQVFEKHGFIWGAKWFHYDTMHFEYRPELLN